MALTSKEKENISKIKSHLVEIQSLINDMSKSNNIINRHNLTLIRGNTSESLSLLSEIREEHSLLMNILDE